MVTRVATVAFEGIEARATCRSRSLRGTWSSSSSACRTRQWRRAGRGCARPWSPPACCSPPSESWLTSRPRICPRRPATTTCRSRSASWPRSAPCRPTPFRVSPCSASSRSTAPSRRSRACSRQRLPRTRAATGLICPAASGPEAAWASADIEVLAPRSLIQLANHFKGVQVMTRPEPAVAAAGAPLPNLRDIRGQESGKRALEITAAGGHNLLILSLEDPSTICGVQSRAERDQGVQLYAVQHARTGKKR